MIEVRFEILRVHRLSFPRDAQEPDCVPDQLTLNFFIEWAIRRETWTVVYFKQVGLTLVVKHDVEAKDFEAHRVLKVVKLTGAHRVLNLWLPSNNRLHNDVLDALHELLRILSLTLL